MDSLGIEYEIHHPNIDEKAIRDEDYTLRAKKIAQAKAAVVFEKFPDAIILAGDSFSVINRNVFEKPADLLEAKDMLLRESGGIGTVYSGFCYIDREQNIDFSTTVEVTYTLRTLSEEEIEKYIADFPVLTWSGALFPGNPQGASMIAEVHGSLNALIYGFPTEVVISCLRQSQVLK